MRDLVSLLIFINLQVTPVYSVLFTDMNSLYTHLTTSRNKNLRPNTDYGTATDISLSFTLLNLQDINAVGGTMRISGYFTVMWKDENLVWTPSSYNNAESIELPYDQLWRPPLINCNNANEMKVFGRSDTYITVSYTGMVTWMPGEDVEFLCDIDTTHYPFDTQICKMMVISWGYPTDKITFNLTENTINTAAYTINKEWDLLDSSVTFSNTPMAVVTFSLTYKRRSLFLFITLVLPALLMAVLNIFAFIIPRGDRIGFSMTLLLTVVVFLTIAQGLLPAVALPRLSALCIVLILDLLMSGMIVISVIVEIWIADKPDTEEIPKRLQSVVKYRPPFCRSKKSNKVHNNGNKNLELEDVNSEHKQLPSKEEEAEEKVTWEHVAKFWDRVCLVTYLTFLVIGNLYYFIDIGT